MLTEPLPTVLDVRRAAVRGVQISGALSPVELPRFRALLASDAGTLEVQLSFSRDEENHYLVRVVVAAEVTVTCQRCLEPLSRTLASDNTLAIVWNYEQAAGLPRHLDPLVVGEEGCNLRELVEDELILALPPFSYHDSESCRETLMEYTTPAENSILTDGVASTNNPFEVLAQLKPGKEQ